MNILMVTNTFTPHVGGVARSVQRFSDEFRRRGYRVLVVAPLFEGATGVESDVLRMPAVQHFSGSDFSVPMPVPGRIASALKSFVPHIVHSHHPFLLGDTALRIGGARNLPVVFTHHTFYEHYTHYVPGDSPRLRRFVLDLVSGYCNLCDAVIAPSESAAKILRQRGVTTRLEVIPTGVDLADFSGGDGAAYREKTGIPAEAFVVGHVGRLAFEKNPTFLAEAVARFLLLEDRAHFLVVGDGAGRGLYEETFRRAGLASRLHRAGVLERGELADAYGAMDVFAFASRSETQGMVLTEAMAAGCPVVAIDAPGVREVVRNEKNGRLLIGEDLDEFAAALAWISTLTPPARQRLVREGASTAAGFSMARCADRTLELYETLIDTRPKLKEIERSPWALARARFAKEWKILRNIAHAAGDAVLSANREDDRECP